MVGRQCVAATLKLGRAVAQARRSAGYNPRILVASPMQRARKVVRQIPVFFNVPVVPRPWE
jgi:hypothetical protein